MFENYKLADLTTRTGNVAQTQAGGKDSAMFRATVVEASPGKAVLNIDGKMLTAETTAELSPNSEIDVMVKGFDGNKVQLQIVSSSSSRGTGQSSGAETASPQVRDMTDSDITSRLAGFDLPEPQAQVPVARSLMRAGIPVTKENLLQLAQAAPPNATAGELDFLASVIKAGGTPTRETLDLMPLLRESGQALPKNMSAVFDLVAKSPGALEELFAKADPATAKFVSDSAAKTIEALLVRPEAEAPAASSGKLQAIGRQFFTASESRLAFIDSLDAAVAAESKTIDSIAAKLTTILKLMPEELTVSTNNLLDQAVRSTADLIRALPAETPAAPAAVAANAATSAEAAETAQLSQPGLEQLRIAIADTLDGALKNASPEQKYTFLREAVNKALFDLMDFAKSAPPDRSQGFFPDRFQQMPDALTNIIDTIKQLDQQSQNTVKGFTAELMAKLNEESVKLLSMKFNAELMPETAKFIDDAAALAAKLPQMSDAEKATTLQQLVKQADTAQLRQELAQLSANMKDAVDLRALLNSLAKGATQTQPDTATTAMNLARNLQVATLSNLVAHDGASRSEAFVTFFPIQVGDRVEIGKLKVYRNTDPESRKGNGKGKEIDPDNASLVIFLDTKYIGLSTIKLNTTRSVLNCAIEVDNKRVKKALDRYIAELKEGLENTQFDLGAISVNVRRPKKAEDATLAEQPGLPPRFTTIDMKI